MLKNLLKYSFLYVVLLFIFFIISFSFVPSIKQFQISFNGDSEKIKYPGFSKKTLQTHEFQKYTETLFEKNIRLRKKIITAHNQFYYALFKKSFVVDGSVIIGKNKQFFVLSYILDYCKNTKKPSELITWADELAKLDRYIRSQGKTFLYIITPSKAEYIPEAIPYRFHCKQHGIKETVYHMDKLLAERKVTYINGPYLMAQTNQIYHMAMFPMGGIHWNWLGASIEAAAIIDALRLKTDFNLPKIKFSYVMTKPKEVDTDNDMLTLAQLWHNYFPEKVPEVQFLNPIYSGKPITAAVIGGSFNWSLNSIFIQNKIFSEINYYFYFDKHQKIKSNEKSAWSKDIKTAEILNSDVIILEENSSVLVSDHGKRFFEKIMHL